METVNAQMTAFDKNSNAIYSQNMVASTKEEVNNQVKIFESEIPFTKYYTEIIVEDINLTDVQKEILTDIDYI